MKTSNIMIATVSAMAGAILVTIFAGPTATSNSTAKSDRLGGIQTETAFLPERFGVPAINQ